MVTVVQEIQSKYIQTFIWTKSDHKLSGKYGCKHECSSVLIGNRIFVYGGKHRRSKAKPEFYTVTGTVTIPDIIVSSNERIAINRDKKHKENNQNNTIKKDSRCCNCQRILGRVEKYKSIYLSVIIHFSDVITDYLVLIQYVFYAYDEYFGENSNHPNINYLFASILSFLTIFLNKVFSSYYIWIFTHNIWDIMLNMFDFYIFKQVCASHETGNKTDLLAYLQKLEKVFESSPQFTIQTFVLLRSQTQNNISYSNGGTGIVQFIQILSILLSLYAISSKLISDDKIVFIESSGANKLFKSKWVYRTLFRLCEVMSNLLLIIVVFVFYGVYLGFTYLCYFLFINFILFRNGLLGENKSNILAHLVAVTNLGITPMHDSSATRTKCISTTFKCIIMCLFNRCICFCKKIINREYTRSLSFYLIITRIVSGFWIALITIILYYTMRNVDFFDHEMLLYVIPQKHTRYQNSQLVQILLWLVLLCHFLQFAFYKLIFQSMNLGVSLQRDFTTYVLNYKFSDAIRLENIKKQQINNVAILKKVLNTIVDQNVPLLGVTRKQLQTFKNITKTQRNQHVYLINEIETVTQTNYKDCQVMLCDILTNAIYNSHLTMISFIIVNTWIGDICLKKFGRSNSQNVLLFLIDNCSHRNDIIKMVTMQYDGHFDNNFGQLLTDETGDVTSYGCQEYVIHQLIATIKNKPDIISYLAEKYWDVFVECNILRYIYVYQMSNLINCIQFPFLTDYIISNSVVVDDYKNEINPNRAEMIVNLLKNHDCDFNLIRNYKKKSRFRYSLFFEYLTNVVINNGNNNDHDVQVEKFGNYLDTIPDLTQTMERRHIEVKKNKHLYPDKVYSIVGAFVDWYGDRNEVDMKNNGVLYLKLFEYLLMKVNNIIDMNQNVEFAWTSELYSSRNVNLLCFVFMRVDLAAIQLFLKHQKENTHFQFVIKTGQQVYQVSKWIAAQTKWTDSEKVEVLELVDNYASLFSQHDMVNMSSKAFNCDSEIKTQNDIDEETDSSSGSGSSSTTINISESSDNESLSGSGASSGSRSGRNYNTYKSNDMSDFVYSRINDDAKNDHEHDSKKHDTDDIGDTSTDASVSKTNFQAIFESILYDSFMENNFVLFDILLNFWQAEFAAKYGTISIFEFGSKNDNLLAMIENEHGNDLNARSLNMAFAVFEKYYNQSWNGMNRTSIVNLTKKCQFYDVIERSVEKSQHRFVLKLCQINFATSTSWRQICRILTKLIKNTTKSQDFVQATYIIDEILNANTLVVANHKRISGGVMDALLDHPNALEWMKVFCDKHTLRLPKRFYVEKVLQHPKMIEIIDNLELRFEYKYFDTTTHKRSSYDNLFLCAVQRDNVYFLNHWINSVTKKKQQHKSAKNMILNIPQLETYCQSAKMIDFLVNMGWVVPQLTTLLRIKNVSPALVKYAIEKQSIQIELHHLNMRMECISKHDDDSSSSSDHDVNTDGYIDIDDDPAYTLDVMHILLTYSDEALKLEFCSIMHRYSKIPKPFFVKECNDTTQHCIWVGDGVYRAGEQFQDQRYIARNQSIFFRKSKSTNI